MMSIKYFVSYNYSSSDGKTSGEGNVQIMRRDTIKKYQEILDIEEIISKAITSSKGFVSKVIINNYIKLKG